jgi:hypothetical protein
MEAGFEDFVWGKYLHGCCSWVSYIFCTLFFPLILSLSPLLLRVYHSCHKLVAHPWLRVSKRHMANENSIPSLSHLVLFVLRCITAFRSGLWSRPIPWDFPVTGLTVQFTVKLLGRGSADGS